MGTTSIRSAVGLYYTATYPVPVQVSTLEVVSRDVTVIRLLETSYEGEGVYACVHGEFQATVLPFPSTSPSQQGIWKEDMRSYLPRLPLLISATRACLYVTIAVSLALDFGSDMRMCSDGLRLMDPSVYILRDTKARGALVGA